MDSARHDQNPDPGCGYAPKLILTGRLTGTLDGRPVSIEASESGLTLSMKSVRTAWRMRRLSRSLFPFVASLKRSSIPVRLSVGSLFTLEVLPRPSGLLRLVAPEFARL